MLLIATTPELGRWTQFDDPLPPQLIEAAQGVGATLAQAEARTADALLRARRLQ
jgi:hypothetical protein